MNNKNELDILVGGNIKRERVRAGYTQEEFSELIGIETKSLSAIERGKVGVSLMTLLRVCQVLSISSSTLLCERTLQNQVQGITERLERLPPEQFSLVSDILEKILQAIADKENN